MSDRLKYVVQNNFLADLSAEEILASGGRLALGVLFQELKSLGEEVYLGNRSVSHAPLFPEYDESDFFDPSKVNPKDCIAIYPEFSGDNVLNCGSVVRWLLHIPGHIGGEPHLWDKEKELFFAYGDWQKAGSEAIGLKVEDLLLTTIHIDHDSFYYKDNPKREGTCYTVHKPVLGEVFRDPVPEGSVCVDPFKRDTNFLSACFHNSEFFYSYDDKTFLTALAGLCGCKVVIASRTNMSKDEWVKEEPYFRKYGVAYGVEDIPHAEETVNLVAGQIKIFEDRASETVKNFVDYTQNHFRIE